MKKNLFLSACVAVAMAFALPSHAQRLIPKQKGIEVVVSVPVIKGEKFTAEMTERQADSLLRADLWKCFEMFKGYGKQGKSSLLRKIEQGDRHYYKEYLFFCHYKGKVLRGLLRRRKAEFTLFYIP